LFGREALAEHDRVGRAVGHASQRQPAGRPDPGEHPPDLAHVLRVPEYGARAVAPVPEARLVRLAVNAKRGEAGADGVKTLGAHARTVVTVVDPVRPGPVARTLGPGEVERLWREGPPVDGHLNGINAGRTEVGDLLVEVAPLHVGQNVDDP